MTRKDLADARGAGRLLFEASTGVVDIVERMHSTIQRVPAPLGAHVVAPTRGITGFVYRTVRGSMQVIGRGVDASLAPLAALLPEGEATHGREALISVVNGVYGDHLARTGNPLAIEMQVRPAAGPAPTGRIVVLVHGLCMSDQHWAHSQDGFGAALARDLGYTPLYVRYNTGLPIAGNGRQLAGLLESLLPAWPCAIERVTIVGHSMGGLVARSACLAAEESRHAWRRQLRDLVFLGSPHQGAPLERGGHGLDLLLNVSPYSAPFTRLGGARSAGIQDLRHGTVTSGGHRHVPLPTDVDCYAVAATLESRRSCLADRLVGDGLVPLHSALGRHADRSVSLRIPRDRQWVGHQMGHLELLRRPEVYERLRAWLQESMAR
jgi:pimeloyl-ACP methyl ester carboxylesterase